MLRLAHMFMTIALSELCKAVPFNLVNAGDAMAAANDAMLCRIKFYQVQA